MLVCDFGRSREGFREGEVREKKLGVDDAVHLVDGLGELGDLAPQLGQLRLAAARFPDAHCCLCSLWRWVSDGPQRASCQSTIVVRVRVGHWW